MDRDNWVTALRYSCEDLFLTEENILTIFTSTGHRFESILSRDVNSVTNIPEIYDTTRDLLQTIKKLFEILPGSTALSDYEIEGESVRFSSYRLGFQRRINILTPLEFNPAYLFKFIGNTIKFFPNKLLSAIGDKETSFLHWSSSEEIPSFLFRAAIADGNSLLERSQMDMNVGSIQEIEIVTNTRNFLVTQTSEELLIVEHPPDINDWLPRLTSLFTRFSKDRQYHLPETNPVNKDVIIHMSMVILRRFLSYLLPPKKKGTLPFSKIATQTNLPEDLLISYFDNNLEQKTLSEFGLQLKRDEIQTKGQQSVNYTLVIDKLSNTRVLSYYLMEINRFFDQYVNILPSKSKPASASGFYQYQSTSSYLGTIWGSFVFGSVLGESDTLFNLNAEVLSEIKELIESRNVLYELKDEIEKYSHTSDPSMESVIVQFKQQFKKLTEHLNDKILSLNEKIAKFTAAIIQSYFIMLKIISIPNNVTTPKKNQKLQSVVELTFHINGKDKKLNDDPKEWITLVFFSHILSQGDVTAFKSSLGGELAGYFENVSKIWDGIQLLTMESEWHNTSQVNQLFIKPSRRRDMMLKILSLKDQK
jgi:hypothetical protein